MSPRHPILRPNIQAESVVLFLHNVGGKEQWDSGYNSDDPTTRNNPLKLKSVNLVKLIFGVKSNIAKVRSMQTGQFLVMGGRKTVDMTT